MTPTEQQNALMYLSLMQVIYEMSEDADFSARPFNKPIVKQRIFDLTHSLNKEIKKIFAGETTDSWSRAVDQHTDASQRMIEFFRIGLEITKLDEIKIQGFDTQLNLLIKSYGINI